MERFNKILILCNLILIITVISLTILFFVTPKSSVHEDPTQTASVIIGDTTKGGKGVSIAYINTDSVVEHYKYYTELKSRLESEQKMAENQLQIKMKELENEYKTLSTKVKLGLIKEEEAQTTFAIKQQEVETFRNTQSQKLIDKNSEMTEQLYDSIVNYVHRFNKNGRFTYILGYAKGGGIIYAPASMDISEIIIGGLNEEYDTRQKKMKKK